MLKLILPLALLTHSATASELQKSGVTSSIRGISAVDAQVCWFGTKGGVARTNDGGKNWAFAKIGDDSLDFRDLHAFDSERCIAMSAGTGAASQIHLTTDGGKTWNLTHQNQQPKGFYNGIAFKDKDHGILAGDPIDGRLFLLTTGDGGASWQRIAEHSAPQMQTGEHSFAASGTHLTTNSAGHIWITSGGSFARVFRSPDWGETWQTIDTPMIAGQPSTGIFSIAFEGQNGIAVGGDYEKETGGNANAMRSRDGGLSWQLVTNDTGTAPFTFRSCIGHLTPSTLLAVGPAGSDISRDAGETWQTLPGVGGFHTLSIAAGVAWTAGADGRVGRLTDLGR